VASSALVDVRVDGTKLRATDIANNGIAMELTGWDRLGDESAIEFDKPIDATVTGRLSEIRYDLQNFIEISRLDGEFIPDHATDPAHAVSTCQLVDDAEYHLSLPEGQYRCQLNSDLDVYIGFTGAASVRYRPSSPLVISFPYPTPVSFGFKSFIDYPRHELQVEPTPDGVATAMTAFSVPFSTTGVDRVHRPYRGYPPLVRTGPETVIPEAVTDTRASSGIEFRLPADLETLYPAAPLAYYLSADVSIHDGPPTLSTQSFTHEFDDGSSFPSQVVDCLRRVFFLDMVGSWHGQPTRRLAEHDALEDAGFVLETYAENTLEERLELALTYSESQLGPVLPPWPTRVTVEPSLEALPALPHLLYDFSAISVTGSSAIDHHAIPASGDPTADALYDRTRIDGRLVTHSSTIQPDGNPEQAVFTSCQQAYRNRLRFLEEAHTELSVLVVVGADVSLSETAKAAIRDRYHRRDAIVSPTVRVLDDPLEEELRDALESGGNLLHAIGSDGASTISCQDGSLEVSSVSHANVELFILDGFDATVGSAFIENGSVGGAIRPARPLETYERPTMTGPAVLLGELLLYGQSLATATALADRCDERSSAPEGGSRVLGDGTHRMTLKWAPKSLHVLDTTDADTSLQVTTIPFPVDPVGAHWYSDLDNTKRLQPARHVNHLEPESITAFLRSCSEPIYYERRIYWPEEHGYLAAPFA